MDKEKLIAVAKARITFYEDLLKNHQHEMFPKDIDRFLGELAKAYHQLRSLEAEADDE